MGKYFSEKNDKKNNTSKLNIVKVWLCKKVDYAI